MYCWGANDFGQLGIGNNENQNTPQQYLGNQSFIFISCGGNHTIGITSKLIFHILIFHFSYFQLCRKW